MNNHYRSLIAAEFRNCVDNTIQRISQGTTHRPFHSALLSDEALFWSSFERSFSTSFGQRVIEEIARIVALSNGAAIAERQKSTVVTLDTAVIEAVDDHIRSLRGGHSMDWASTIASIRRVPKSGNSKSFRVISDLWWNKDGIDTYMSINTVKQNIDQTAVAKQDCLHLVMANPNCNAYFGLPYNPFGENREDYSFNPPMGIFDFRHDPVVLIGADMWDTVGGEGCYNEILEIANQVGIETKEKISRLLGNS